MEEADGILGRSGRGVQGASGGGSGKWLQDFRGGLDKFDFARRAALIFMETPLLRQYPIFYWQTSLSTLGAGGEFPACVKRCQCAHDTYWFHGDLPQVRRKKFIRRWWRLREWEPWFCCADFRITKRCGLRGLLENTVELLWSQCLLPFVEGTLLCTLLVSLL